MTKRTVLAVDIGAESGRVVASHFDGQRLQTEDLHRFPNIPVEVRGTLHWDLLRLWHEIQAGIRLAKGAASIGLDTWGVDFAFLDSAGNLLGNPVHYRDHRTDGMIDYVLSKMPRAEIFARTGIQFMPINSLYQLASLSKNHHPVLEQAASFVAVPDLLYYWLTGVKVNEFSITSTMQLYDPRAGDWAFDLLDAFGLPRRLFGEVTHPGAILGKYGEIPVTLAPHHDTADAVVGVPSITPNYAYISSGTWSLLGVERPEPVINEAALAANITNEGGYGGTFRILKNIMGLWLLQESRRTWASNGEEYSYDKLAALASEAPPFVSLVDPDIDAFLNTGDMPARIRHFCEETDQPIPDSVAAVTRCIFESLAFKYRYVLNLLMGLTGQKIDTLHIVGGGSQNALLCQMAADATGCKVIAGPNEATSLGNAVVQLIALGDLKSVAEGRALIRESFPLVEYEPRHTADWDAVAPRFNKLVERNTR
ncbi:MAG: rhamnulokinase family protein [Chloroflexota bacterium]